MEKKRKAQRNSKNRIKMTIILTLVIIVISIIIVFGRYITSTINDFYLKSKEFYFNSDKLKTEKAIYQVENWSGVDDYTITVNMNSMENNLKSSTYDIPYKISYTCF